MLLVLAAGLYAVDLGYPDRMYGDEIWYVPDARVHALGAGALTNPEHPPLGKLIMAGSIALFGDRPVAWRLPGVLSTLAMLCVLGALAVRWFGLLGLLAPVMIILDPIVLTSSRVGSIDAQLGLWLVAGAGALIIAFESKPANATLLAVASGLLGVALAIKWTTLTVLGVVAVVALSRVEDRKHIRVEPKTVLVLAAPAAAVYTLAYVMAGYDPIEMLLNQWEMVSYHTVYYSGGAHMSNWWWWFVLLEPFWYLLDENPLRAIIAVGTPLWPVGGICALYGGYVGLRRRQILPLALTAFAVMQLVLWTGAARMTFIYYMTAISPFLALSTVWALSQLRLRLRIASTALLVLGAAAWFVYLWPVLTASPMSEDDFVRKVEGPVGRVIRYQDQPSDLIRSAFMRMKRPDQ